MTDEATLPPKRFIDCPLCQEQHEIVTTLEHQLWAACPSMVDWPEGYWLNISALRRAMLLG